MLETERPEIDAAGLVRLAPGGKTWRQIDSSACVCNMVALKFSSAESNYPYRFTWTPALMFWHKMNRLFREYGARIFVTTDLPDGLGSRVAIEILVNEGYLSGVLIQELNSENCARAALSLVDKVPMPILSIDET
jgi:hypothetical protein